ncbi:DNA polymerase-3 subunit gamma/tau [Tessaracoccus oleiagri]|uniref:DNA polymerase III subunit gamma/tau n=2 Tax=Tessaracoccus oleiagri TaxID=686624 RepID=A0A1G9N0Z6_9ACTN|nr:DNA polymerase-3 subunit gamma/tau [Tessaracoccus oleiagri]
MEDEDEYSLFDEPIVQDGPDLFEEADEPAVQDGPDLFGDEPEPAAEAVAPVASDVAPMPSKLGTGARPTMSEQHLALYRRYRPDTFADVIGQDHVTVPLQRALANNKVNHAYLFSGPRGCGKTTSARILARCLNCEQGPTPTPCGRCQSCVDLARGGPGSIDVIEIDAASHGGVDDARDLRERAFFAPVASRYKIYIVDEAHMVTAAGFNALLKLVEEPPPHAKFIFATTEPEKVIGTIRSRTHHYPFRLVPPRTLTNYLGEICEAEGVQVDAQVLPLVVRAGAGSVRDSLSVLDQLLGGAGSEGVEYEQAAALLGYTPDTLLDDIVDAFAAGDFGAVFRTIDKVIEIGQDPRRFAEDLLRRLRDLVILAAVPSAIDDGILEVAADQGERLKSQAAALGAGELTRAAEVLAVGLTEMRGTTAPRLHLELMCARVLLPGADLDERGLHARMDRLERRVGMMGSPEAPTEPQQWADVPSRPAPEPARPAPIQRPVAAAAPEPQPASVPVHEPAPEPVRQPTPAQRPPGAPPRQRPAGAPPSNQPAAQRAPEPTPQPAAAPATAAVPGQLTTAEMRRAWPSVLEEVKSRRRFTYMLLSQNSQVQEVTDGTLVLGFANPGARDNFGQGGSHDVLVDSIIEVLGVELRVQGVVANEKLAQRGQRSAGTMPEQPQPPNRPEPEPPSEPEYVETSADDEELDATSNAEALLTRELGAQVISVEEDNPGPT